MDPTSHDLLRCLPFPDFLSSRNPEVHCWKWRSVCQYQLDRQTQVATDAGGGSCELSKASTSNFA